MTEKEKQRIRRSRKINTSKKWMNGETEDENKVEMRSEEEGYRRNEGREREREGRSL